MNSHPTGVPRAHHTGLTVSDLARSLAFYRDLLGLEEVFGWNPKADYIGTLVGYPDVDLHAVILRSADGAFLELLEYRGISATPVEPANGNPGTAHVAFAVDDLDERYQRLVAAGARALSEPVTPTIGPNAGGRAVYLLDPDGIRVELIQAERDFGGEPASRVEPETQAETQSEFLVTITNGYPFDDPGESLPELLEAEHARAVELAEAGVLQRLWRRPDGRSNVGLWRAADLDRLHEALASLPFFPWLTVEVTALATHPSDPERKPHG